MFQKVGFVGIGVMGFHMAKHLVEKGFEVTVYDHNADKCQALAEVGAKVAPSLDKVAADAEIVFTMLPNENIVREVILGEGGVASGAKPGTVFANSSTVSPQSNVSLAADLEKLGMRFLEDPVTGSGLQSKAGTLVFIGAGEKELFDQAMPLYEAMGKGAYYGGPKIGSAAYAKLASNAMMAMNMCSFAEALTIAYKAGVDPEMFVNFCTGGGPRSAMADLKVGKIMKRDFSPTFFSRLMYKDTVLSSDLARNIGVPTPMLNLAKELFNITCLEGYSEDDLCAVVKLYENWASVTIEKE